MLIRFTSKLGKLSREQREQWGTGPGSFVSPVDIKGLEKTIREVAPEVEQLEFARNEDRAMIRELEIGLLKGLFTYSKSEGSEA